MVDSDVGESQEVGTDGDDPMVESDGVTLW